MFAKSVLVNASTTMNSAFCLQLMLLTFHQVQAETYYSETYPRILNPALSSMQAELEQSKKAQDQKQAEQWRKWLHMYLDELFQNDSSAGAEFHALQVRVLSPFYTMLSIGCTCTYRSWLLRSAPFWPCCAGSRQHIRQSEQITGRATAESSSRRESSSPEAASTRCSFP